jgi:hypothetical protein
MRCPVDREFFQKALRKCCNTAGDRILLFSIGILGILLVLDILTTTIILGSGGMEYNPFMTVIIQNPLVHFLVKVSLLVLVLVVARKSESVLKNSGEILTLVLICLYIVVVGNNLAVIVAGGTG